MYDTNILVARTCSLEAVKAIEAALPVHVALLPSVTKLPSSGAAKPLAGLPLTPMNSIMVIFPAEHANVVVLFLYRRYSLSLFNIPFEQDNVILLLLRGDSPLSIVASKVTLVSDGSLTVRVYEASPYKYDAFPANVAVIVVAPIALMVTSPVMASTSATEVLLLA